MADRARTLDTLTINDRAGGARLSVRVRPRASRSAILGVREGALDVAIAAPPVDGAANAELLRLMARELGVPQSTLSITAGAGGRNKVLEIAGQTAEQVRQRLR